MSQSIQIQVTQVGLEQSIAAAMKRVGNSSQINLGTSSKQINALSQPLGRITGQADEFSKSMAAANARVLAFGASAGIIAGVSKAMSGLVTSTIKVEKSLVEINSVLNKTGAELDKFGQDIFNVAKNTGKSFDEVANGALELARQGLNAEDTLARLNDALILSRLSGLDAAQSVEGLTAAFNSFQKSGITTSEILNKVVAVSQKYAVSERDIIEGVKRSASVAQQAGVSFDELAAVITAVQQTTARGGAVIGNSFKTIFARIQRKDVLSDLQNMGVAVTDLQGNVLPALRILENLAGQLNNFSQIEQANIAEKLGGVFQLDKLLAALNDISDKSSVTSGALKVMGEAGNSAYQKNIILNQTLAALLNKVAVNAEQLGAKLGEIGVTDSLKNVLGIFNDLLEGIQKVLGEESGLGNLVRGLVKGLGSFLAGPGLALFGGIILKLSKDLVQFGFASLKAFFGIGKAAKEVQNVEGAISQILAKNVNLQQQLFALEGNRAAQLRVITAALVEQEAVLRRSSQISSGLAAPLYNVGARGTASGLRVGNSADGYMPAVAKESQSIRQGVGGARAGDKPVVIPNFSFGGGRKGTMVAHTGEYIVPNFSGSGGTAVFNRQMVQSMGLPSGAKKIGAAGGFVPNFFRGPESGASMFLNQLNLTGSESPQQVADLINKKGYQTTVSKGGSIKVFNKDGTEEVSIDYNSKLKTKLNEIKSSYNAEANPNEAVMLIPQNSPYNQSGADTVFKKDNIRTIGNKTYTSFKGAIAGVRENLTEADGKNFEKISKIDKRLEQALSDAAFSILNEVQPGIVLKDNSPLKPENIKNVLEAGGKGAFGALRGALFETVISQVARAKGRSFERGSLDIDFEAGDDNSRKVIETIFGLPENKYEFADLKNSLDQKDKYIDQVMTYLPKDQNIALAKKVSSTKGPNAAGGFIPNFAKYIYDSDRLAPDKGATLAAILASKVKKNLIIGPAGSGKSTYAGKMGQFLSGIDDVSKASEIDILSGAARAKGGISKNLESIIAAVNASGGKVSYLYTKNLEILSRRMGRTSPSEGDLRSTKQLKGTKYAPLNQFDFLSAVKSKARNFNLINGASGFIPNFAGGVSNRALENAKRLLEKLKPLTGIAKTLGFDQFLNAVLPNGISPVEQDLVAKSLEQVIPAAKAGFQELKKGPAFGVHVTKREMGPFKSILKDLMDLDAGIPLRPDSHINSSVPMVQGLVKRARIAHRQIKEQARRNIEDGAAGGFLPNFASPLQAAVGREMAAGVPASQIYIDKSPALKNAANPMGLMVANRRDEPAGGFQGINRARREGANPMMYGAAGGFVPNYASLTKAVSQETGIKIYAGPVQDAIDKFAKESLKAGADMKKLAKQLENQLKIVTQGNPISKQLAQVAQEEMVKRKEIIAAKALESTAGKKVSSKLDKILQEYNQSEKTAKDLAKAQAKAAAALNKTTLNEIKKSAITSSIGSLAATRPGAQPGAGNRDMLGTLFAVQGAMSALTGATDDASNSVARYGNIVAGGAGSFATAAFAIQGISQMGGAIGGIASKLGPYGLAIAGTLAAFSIGGKIMDEYNGVNKSAAASMAKVAEAAQKAAVKLEDLSPTAQSRIKESAKNLVAGATNISYQDILTGIQYTGKTEFEGFDKFGFGTSEIEKSLQASVDAALAAGVSYDLMFNTIQEAAKSGGKTTKEEVDSMVAKFAELQVTTEKVKKVFEDLNLQPNDKLIKDIENINFNTLEKIINGKDLDLSEEYDFSSGSPKTNPKINNAREVIASLQSRLQSEDPSFDVNSEAGKKILLDQIKLIQDRSDAIKKANEEAIEQTRTSIVQDKLKNAIALSIAKARSFENDILGQRLLKGQELGTLDEKALRNIQDQIALREINRELQDGTANLIQEQISQAKKITAESEVAIALEEKFKNLSAEQLQDRTVVNSLLQETSQLLEQNLGLNEQQKNALQVALDKLFSENKIKKDNLQLTQEQTAQYKEQARQLDLISQASKRALQGQLFSGEISTARSINSNNAQIRTLESSKLGRDEVQIRQIDQQIAELKKNNVLLEQSNAREKIFQDMKAELSENNKITDQQIKENFENQIQQAKTVDQLKGIAAAIFMQNAGQDRDLNQSKLQDFIQKYQESLIKQGIDAEEARKQAEAEVRDAGRISPVIDALEMFRRSLLATSQIIDQKIEDIKLQQLTSISGKEILQGNYDIETLRQQRGQTPAEAARIARQRQNKGLGQLFAEEYTKTDEERALNINQAIVDGSVQFKNNMIEGIMGAIEGTTDLKDSLRSAAYEFVKMINQRMMSNLVDKLVGGSVPSGGGAPSGGLAGFFSNMFASGGKVTGGSGSKDDVPAMLMGGEYVVNKKAVSKYGPKFLEAINNGTLNGYANGGMVSSGSGVFDKMQQTRYDKLMQRVESGKAVEIQRNLDGGGFYTPGTYGQGAIYGKGNLLDFATQSGTSGKFDQIFNESGYQAISLEPESSQLSVSGMRNTPMFEATQSAKQQAFDLYLQQYNQEIEAKKQAKAQKKAFRNQLIMMAASVALGPIIQAGAAGFKSAFNAAKAGGATGFQSFLAGTKGIAIGGKIPGMQGNVGGLRNLFSGVGKAFTGDFGGAVNKFKLSQIGTQDQLLSAMKNEKFASYINQQGGFIPKAQVVPSLSGIPIGASRGANGVTFNSNDGDIIKNIQGDVGVYGSDIEAGLLPSMQRKSRFNIFKSIGSGVNKMGSIFSSDKYGPFDKNGDYNEEAAEAWEKANGWATGGMIPSTSGIDTVPAMLSGGEFVMNRSAVQSIGAPNLQSMNAGGTSITSEETSKELNEKLLAKLDELIKVSDSSTAGNITINVDSSTGKTMEDSSNNSPEQRQQLARRIKEVVLQVINEEKRLGGSLRR